MKVLANCFVGLIYFIIWGLLMMVAVKLGEAKEEVTVVKVEVPVMKIQLNGVTLKEVHENGKEVKYKGNKVFLNGEEFDDVEFKGRGNFSWAADKKSYRLKFESKVDLLGLGKAKKWALVANSVDDSLMRNDLAQHLMGMIVDDYPFEGGFVDLIIDDEKLGLYYLIKTMSVAKGTVDLNDPMGVLVELDNAYCRSEEKWYETAGGNCLTLKDGVEDDNVDAAMEDFLADFNNLEIAVESGDYKTAAEIMDLESFAKYFIISELTANPDAYLTSWFFYKDGLDDKIHADLAWDFDAAFGNHEWGGTAWPEEFYSPDTTMARLEYTFGIGDDDTKFCNYSDRNIGADLTKISLMMCRMMNDEDFRESVGKIYREKIVGRENEIIQYIDDVAEIIREAAIKDAEIWEKGDFGKEVEYLKWWIQERMRFFEEKYAKNLAAD